MGYTKRNKRCIPKRRYATCPKGMKKRSAKKGEKMHTQRRYATCPQDMSKKKKRRKKYSPCPRKKKYKEREIDHAKEFIHYPPEVFHTLAPLD